MRAKDVVHRFLASIGRPSEANQYLDYFQSQKPERFAFVFVHDDVLSNADHGLRADLRFLKQLELTPVLCVSSDQIRQALLSNALQDVVACDVEQAGAVCAAGDIAFIVAASPQSRAEAIATLRPRKAVYLIPRSGLQPEDEEVRSLVDLHNDYQELLGKLPAEQADLLTESRLLLDATEHHFTVSITSPLDLLRELFTVRGAGTLVRRGTQVLCSKTFRDIDQERLGMLLESAFGSRPQPEFYARDINSIYVASDYRGAAVIEDKSLAPYLSKFAVDIQARGEGIGGDLWRALIADQDRFFWRSRQNNPITPWYEGQCDGLVRTGVWTVFWRGLMPGEIPQAVELANNAPKDF